MVRLSSVLGQLSIGGVFGMVEVGFMNDGLAEQIFGLMDLAVSPSYGGAGPRHALHAHTQSQASLYQGT